MQYKQIRRIVQELFLSEDLPKEIHEKLIPLIARDDWPRVGPFKKHCAGQFLWKVASDSRRSATERWAGLEKLIEVVKAIEKDKRSIALGTRIPTW